MYRFSPNSLLWGSLLGKKRLAAICPGRVSGACSPNSLLWGSLLEKKRLAAICGGRVSRACPPCVRQCPPCVRLDSALAAPPNLVRPLSAFCVCLVYVHLPAMCLLLVRHVPILCELRSTMWTLSACGQLWRRAVASRGKILSQNCAAHRVYLYARWSVSLAFILAPQIWPLQVRPTPCACGTVWGLCWCNPPCVRLCAPLVRHLSALCCCLWPRLRSLSATCPPCVRLVLLALAAPPVLVRHLSALCLRLAATCPPCVRLVLLALAAPPVLVRLMSASPPLVCHQSLSAIRPPCDRHLSATCPPCVVPQAVYFPKRFAVGFSLRSNMLWPRPGACPPCVRHCPPCVRHCVRLDSARVSKPCPLESKFGWPRLQLCRPCVRLVSAMCLPCVPPCITL